ncbi:hypothetical protein M0R45_026143 [Rubus argutus]|uniref:DOG1 domain-containing protein n=1 Tax=Rubus argutus TaxID=59490 RepID=A0AAW1WWS0_RUBAR
MGIYEPFTQVGVWRETFSGGNSSNVGVSTIVEVDSRLENKIGFASHESMVPAGNDHESNRTADKAQRRLEQNREAARKSRMRKKVAYGGSAFGGSHIGYNGIVNSGITTFEMDYGNWVEEQHRQIIELRKALQDHATEIELQIRVESGLNHYATLFRMKADAAKADIFYLLSGIWRTSVERYFHWIRGFRPSELLNILEPQIEPLPEPQRLDFYNLRQSSQQAEDALSQGMDKLQQTLAKTLEPDQILSGESYGSQMAVALEKFEALEIFLS